MVLGGLRSAATNQGVLCGATIGLWVALIATVPLLVVIRHQRQWVYRLIVAQGWLVFTLFNLAAAMEIGWLGAVIAFAVVAAVVLFTCIVEGRQKRQPRRWLILVFATLLGTAALTALIIGVATAVG